jgi:hypothetical protein
MLIDARSFWPSSLHYPRRSSLRGSWHLLASSSKAMQPATCSLQSFTLIRSRPTPSHHHIPPRPPRNQPLPSLKAERETKHALRHSRTHSANAAANEERNGLRAFAREAWLAFKQNWVLLTYMVIVMASFNACSHGSQDFYVTFLKDQVGESATNTTTITAIGKSVRCSAARQSATSAASSGSDRR